MYIAEKELEMLSNSVQEAGTCLVLVLLYIENWKTAHLLVLVIGDLISLAGCLICTELRPCKVDDPLRDCILEGDPQGGLFMAHQVIASQRRLECLNLLIWIFKWSRSRSECQDAASWVFCCQIKRISRPRAVRHGTKRWARDPIHRRNSWFQIIQQNRMYGRKDQGRKLAYGICYAQYRTTRSIIRFRFQRNHWSPKVTMVNFYNISWLSRGRSWNLQDHGKQNLQMSLMCWTTVEANYRLSFASSNLFKIFEDMLFWG